MGIVIRLGDVEKVLKFEVIFMCFFLKCMKIGKLFQFVSIMKRDKVVIKVFGKFDFIFIRVSGNGNCFFNFFFMVIQGNEFLVLEIRVWICIEM